MATQCKCDCAEKRRHSGWTNYETWCVNLWIGNNDEATYRHWQRRANYWNDADSTSEYWTQSESAKFNLADELKDSFEQGQVDALKEQATLFSDMLGAAFEEVNWHEIAEGMLDALAESDSGQ